MNNNIFLIKNDERLIGILSSDGKFYDLRSNNNHKNNNGQKKPIELLPPNSNIDRVISFKGITYVLMENLHCYQMQLDASRTSTPRLETVAGLPPNAKVVSMASDGKRVLFMSLADGTCYGKGNNDKGQLGIGNNQDVSAFTRVLGLPINDPVVRVAAGPEHTVLCTEAGTCYVAGDNESVGIRFMPQGSYYYHKSVPWCQGDTSSESFMTGSLVDISGYDKFTPLSFKDANGSVTKVISVASGPKSIIVSLEDGTCHGIGLNFAGHLGMGDSQGGMAHRVNGKFYRYFSAFQLVSGLPNDAKDPVVNIITDSASTFVLTEKGYCYATGANDQGQLGLGHNDNINKFTLVASPSPKPSPELSPELSPKPSPKPSSVDGHVINVVTNRGSTFMLTKDGRCYMTGANGKGQLGLSNNQNINKFTLLISSLHSPVINIVTDGESTFMLTNDGRCYATGANDQGQLQLGLKPKNINTFTFTCKLFNIISHPQSTGSRTIREARTTAYKLKSVGDRATNGTENIPATNGTENIPATTGTENIPAKSGTENIPAKNDTKNIAETAL
jgi:alpha-tubulin suppressor-like RCC1 family protein